MNAFKDAKQVLAEASKRRHADPAFQGRVEEANAFLDDLAEAIRARPNIRTRSIIEDCARLEHHLRIARRIIVRTPKSERWSSEKLRALAKQTKLEPAVVRRFLDKPKTGARTYARELVGKAYDISAEQVRTLQKKFKKRYPVKLKLLPMEGRRK